MTLTVLFLCAKYIKSVECTVYKRVQSLCIHITASVTHDTKKKRMNFNLYMFHFYCLFVKCIDENPVLF